MSPVDFDFVNKTKIEDFRVYYDESRNQAWFQIHHNIIGSKFKIKNMLINDTIFKIILFKKG